MFKLLEKNHKYIEKQISITCIFFIGLHLILFFPATLKANNIQVANGVLVGQNIIEGYWMVQFDLSWENSWRTDNLFPGDGHDVGNWDAAWVFVKYRLNGGEWQHAKLHNSGHSAGTGTPATVQTGLINENEAFHITDNPGVGAFIFRSENGNGTFSVTGAQLRWNYGAAGIANSAELEIKIFAIEMVYVAPGPFYLGSGGDELGRFIAGGTSNSSFLVTENWNGCIEDVNGCLWGTETISPSRTIGDVGILNEYFPTGLKGFYSMKYSVNQQQYVDFLNTLTSAQASTRAYTGGANRNGISVAGGIYSTTNPFVANNWMSWMDGMAFADWAGLRPMTELEFEKAARGPLTPVPNEYAWGTTSIIQANGVSNAGLANEVPTPANSNAVYTVTGGGLNPLGGPVRVGSFAQGTTTREQSGAGYWGIMELSGNLWERPVTVGNNEGRIFTGLHGNGQLTPEGHGAVENWPGGGASGITNAHGGGLRGCNWVCIPHELSISNRGVAAFGAQKTVKTNARGFRGVRSLPAQSN